MLNICLVLMGGTLLVDAGAYTLVGPEYPLALRYFLNLLSFTASGFNAIAFIYYTEALFNEKSSFNPWYFRILKTAAFALVFCSIYEFIAGHLVSYDAGGFENINYQETP